MNEQKMNKNISRINKQLIHTNAIIYMLYETDSNTIQQLEHFKIYTSNFLYEDG